MKPVTVEEKIYRALGVKQYCRFLVWIKLHYDQWRGKTDTDNYFLKSGKLEDLHFLQQQLIKNAKIHGFGAVLCFACALAAGRFWIVLLAALVRLHNLYCVLVQRMNLIRLSRLLGRMEKKREPEQSEELTHEHRNGT